MLGRCPRGAREEQGLLHARPRPTTTRRLAGPCCSVGRVLLPIGRRRCPPRGGAEAEECRWRRRRAQTIDSQRSPLGTTSRGRASPLPISMVNSSSGTRSMLKLSFTFPSSKASSVIEEEEEALKKIVPKYSRSIILFSLVAWDRDQLAPRRHSEQL